MQVLIFHELEYDGHDDIEKSRYDDTAECIGQTFARSHRNQARDKGKGTSQEYGNLEFGDHMEQQGSDTCREQCHTNIQPSKDWDQYSSTEHDERMLKSQYDGLSVQIFSRHTNLLFSFSRIVVVRVAFSLDGSRNPNGNPTLFLLSSFPPFMAR
jgi:hypothetical protein